MKGRIEMANWYLQNGKDSDVVISTRVRLARNINGFNFESRCSKEEKGKIAQFSSLLFANSGLTICFSTKACFVISSMSFILKSFNPYPKFVTIPLIFSTILPFSCLY